jgi:serine/threonine-protein kinase
VPGLPGGEDGWDDDEAARRRRRNRVVALVVGALVLIGAVVGGALLLGSPDEEPAATATQVSVPDVVGQEEQAARSQLEEAGLTVGQVTTQASSAEQEGLVLSTDPAGGAQVDPDSEVTLVVGAGPDTLTVPPVVNLDADDAETALRNAGFTGNINTDQVDSLEDENTVVAADPGQGSQAAPDAEFTLQVSDGTVAVPDVVAQDEATARDTLGTAGFTRVTTEEVDSDQPAGTVVASDPAAGTQASADEQVTLQVSGGPGEITIPTGIVGVPEAVARQALAQAGFTGTITVQPTEGTGGQAPGTVAGSDPQPGRTVEPDAEITLLVVQPSAGPGGTGTSPATPTG